MFSFFYKLCLFRLHFWDTNFIQQAVNVELHLIQLLQLKSLACRQFKKLQLLTLVVGPTAVLKRRTTKVTWWSASVFQISLCGTLFPVGNLLLNLCCWPFCFRVVIILSFDWAKCYFLLALCPSVCIGLCMYVLLYLCMFVCTRTLHE